MKEGDRLAENLNRKLQRKGCQEQYKGDTQNLVGNGLEMQKIKKKKCFVNALGE